MQEAKDCRFPQWAFQSSGYGSIAGSRCALVRGQLDVEGSMTIGAFGHM